MNATSAEQPARPPRVEIFHSPMCSLCHEAMDFFRERGVAFDAYEVRWRGDTLLDSEHARELLRRCGSVEYVPQIFVDGKRIGGWQSLSQLIATGELEALLAPEGRT